MYIKLFRPAYFLLFLLMSTLMSCQQNAQTKALKAYEQGQSLSAKATIELENRNVAQSNALLQQAIDKFHEVLIIDSTNIDAAAALGHSYFMLKEFKKGIEWYEVAIAVDTTSALNYLEYGLCEINQRNLEKGSALLQKALEVDASKTTLDQAVYGLLKIGIMAFDYGTGYQQEGELKKGLAYKQFSLKVLQIANLMDGENTEVVNYLIDFSEKVGDPTFPYHL